MSSPFDMITVTLAGDEIQARPIEWDYDEEGSPEEAIKFETTCPNCSQMLQFELFEITSPPDNFIRCENCGAGEAEAFQEDSEDGDLINNEEALGAEEEAEIVVSSSANKLRNPLDFDYPTDNLDN